MMSVFSGLAGRKEASPPSMIMPEVRTSHRRGTFVAHATLRMCIITVLHTWHTIPCPLCAYLIVAHPAVDMRFIWCSSHQVMAFGTTRVALDEKLLA